MTDKRAWIVGASGTLGRALTGVLRRHGYEIPRESTRFELCDPVAVRAAFQRWLREGEPVALFHCAANVELTRTEQDPGRTAAVNELGLINVIQALGAIGLHPWTCAVSSGHCYAPMPRPERVDEHAPLAPRSAYAVSKLNAERWATLLGERHDIPVFIPRVFSFTGAHQKPSFVVPRLARLIRSAPPGAEIRTGWLDAYRDFLDVGDVAAALLSACEARCLGVMNVCSGNGRQIRTIAEAFLDAWRAEHPASAPPRLAPGGPRPDDTEWMVGDPARFEAATGFHPNTPWQETIENVWTWTTRSS